MCIRDSVPNTKIHTFYKVLPERGQHTNFHAFSKGTDRGFSRILVDFAFFNTFWTSFWTLPSSAMLSSVFIFLHFLWIRAIFWSKSMNFRRLVQSVTGTWPKAFRTRKSIVFAKCYRDVVKTRIFMHFQRVLIEDFRGFWLISRFSTVFEHRFERFQVAQCFQMRSFSCIFYGSDQFSGKKTWNFDA